MDFIDNGPTLPPSVSPEREVELELIAYNIINEAEEKGNAQYDMSNLTDIERLTMTDFASSVGGIFGVYFVYGKDGNLYAYKTKKTKTWFDNEEY